MQYTIMHWGERVSRRTLYAAHCIAPLKHFPGELSYLTRQYWPFPLYISTTGITAAIVQMFLIYRIWVL